MKLLALILAAGILCSLVSRGAVVSFGQTDYTVQIGQSLALDVQIAFDQGDPATNLFSFGVRAIPAGGTPFTLDNISVVPELDNFGTGGGSTAFIDSTPSVLGAKGNVFNFGSPYMGALLATYTMHFTAKGDYPVGLDFFNTLGPTEQIFIGGNGSVLDSNLTFGSTLVHVIPEPGTASLLAFAAVGLFVRRRDR